MIFNPSELRSRGVVYWRDMLICNVRLCYFLAETRKGPVGDNEAIIKNMLICKDPPTESSVGDLV